MIIPIAQCCKCWWIFLELNSKGPLPSSEGKKATTILYVRSSVRKTLFTEFHVLVDGECDARAELVFVFKNYCFFDVFVAVFVFIFFAQRAWYIYAIMVHVPIIIVAHKSGPLAKFHQICYLCLTHFIHRTRFPLPDSRPLANFNHSRHIWQIRRFHRWWHSVPLR